MSAPAADPTDILSRLVPSRVARGFAVVKDAEGAIVRRAVSVTPGDVLDIEFADDKVAAVASSGTGKARPASRPKPGSGQGSLF